MTLPRNAYTLRFGSAAEATITKEEAMTLARSRGMSLRAFILGDLADDGRLGDEQFVWLRDQLPESNFDGENQLGPLLWSSQQYLLGSGLSF